MKNVTFDHVKGVEEAKNELQEVVEFLKNPQKFTALGGKLPKGETATLHRCHCIFSIPIHIVSPSVFRSSLGWPSRNWKDPTC